MHPTLNETQIEQLFQFCRQHYVRQYDVQIELVDHMANAVEQLMADQPDIHFAQAVQQVHQRFGPTGFRKVVAAQERSMEQAHRSFYKQALLAYVRLPKILFTLCCIALIYWVHQLVRPYPVLQANVLITICILSTLLELLVPIYLYFRFPRPRIPLLCRSVYAPFFTLYLTSYPVFKIIADYFFDPLHFQRLSTQYFLPLSLMSLGAALLMIVYKDVHSHIYRTARQTYPMAY